MDTDTDTIGFNQCIRIIFVITITLCFYIIFIYIYYIYKEKPEAIIKGNRYIRFFFNKIFITLH